MANQYEVLSIGNAIVDLLSHVDEDFLVRHGLDKGAMRLVDEKQSKAMLETLGETRQASGGSAANTAACIASLGAGSAYIGKVAADELGNFFGQDMEDVGVSFHCDLPHDGVTTANCLAVVTPDGERTMSTYLGACRELSVDDVSESLVRQSQIVFLEGYLLDSPNSSAALHKAAKLGKKNGRMVAITLSDSRCVERHRQELLDMIARVDVDVVIANEKEIVALLASELKTSDPMEILSWCSKQLFQTFVVTLGAEGAAVAIPVMLSDHDRDRDDYVIRVPAQPVENIVDLVGAGDSFAAGYLVGKARGLSDERSATLGTICASRIIQTEGARPQSPLSELAEVAELLEAFVPAA